jgi:predicted amino acid dehydrogenase
VEQTETPIGVSGLILLPYNMDELRKLPRPSLHELLLEGIEIAKQQGARAISLAGMLPSMTNYGYGLVEEMPVASSPSSNRYLTSGHACTVIAVVKTIQKVLEVLNISISELKVAIVGYGSIGQSSLALLLELTDQPLELMIIEEERQLSNLLAPLAELKARFSNKMSVYTNRGQEVAPEVYQADLIIGASSSGSILDINLLKPGTVLIDDSFPSIINVPKSIERMQKKRDVLAVGGGKLEIGQLARQHFVRGLPESAVSSILSKLGVQGMPGCRVESLLQSNEPALPAVVGLVSPQVARQYLAKINALNIDAADLHLGSHAISKEVLESMKQLFTLRFHKPHSNE